jgi:hypothetical protein
MLRPFVLLFLLVLPGCVTPMQEEVQIITTEEPYRSSMIGAGAYWVESKTPVTIEMQGGTAVGDQWWAGIAVRNGPHIMEARLSGYHEIRIQDTKIPTIRFDAPDTTFRHNLELPAGKHLVFLYSLNRETTFTITGNADLTHLEDPSVIPLYSWRVEDWDSHTTVHTPHSGVFQGETVLGLDDPAPSRQYHLAFAQYHDIDAGGVESNGPGHARFEVYTEHPITLRSTIMSLTGAPLHHVLMIHHDAWAA